MPGRGLRRAELAQMARHGGSGRFAVSLSLDTPFGEHRLGTGIEAAEEGRSARLVRIDGGPAPRLPRFPSICA
jgi:DNA replication and repair protein RecF